MNRQALPHHFLSRVESLVGSAYVVSEESALAPYSRDETPNLPPSMPDAVVRPGTVEEVQGVVRLCAEGGVPVTPRGAGTGQSGGCVPVKGGVVLVMDRLNKIQKVDQENLLAKVEPGLVLGDFHQAVEDLNLFYPPDPASLQWCTLGGNVAENAGGPRALRYGVTGDYVLGLEAVLPTGELIRTGKETVKGVAGYDLTSMICGSEGTLAVITGLTLKLIPKPRAVQTALVIFDSAEKAARGVAGILAGGIVPRTLEYMDRTSIRAVRNHGAPYRFPENAGAALILETDGDSEDHAFMLLSRALEIADRLGALQVFPARDASQRRDIWQSRRLLSEATRRIKARKVSEDIVVPRSEIPAMVAYVDLLGEEENVGTCAFGHAGDGNLHVQVLFDHEDELPRVQNVVKKLFRKTIEMGGTISGEHGIGLAKQPYLPWEQSPTVIDLQRRIKKAFDPAGILNPGKFLPEP
jgi:glycolate oxidase